MRYYWTNERYQITYGKSVIHVVTTMRDHGYFSFTTRVSGKFFNQILLACLIIVKADRGKAIALYFIYLIDFILFYFVSII